MPTVNLLIQTISSNKSEYERELSSAIKNNLTTQEFDQLDDYLLDLIKTKPFLAKEISLINLKIFKQISRPFWVGYTYNTLINSLIFTNSIELIFPYFKESLIFCMENEKMFAAGHSICSNLKNAYNLFKQDELLEIIKLSVDFYKKYKKNKLAIKNMIEASLIFSNFGSYQSAYRLIADAETLCIENNLEQLHADVIATLGTIAMEEADFSFAEGAYRRAFGYYRKNNKKIPLQHLYNWGTTLIRTNRYPEAEGIYKMIKSEYPKFQDPRIDLNLAIAYKNQEKFDLALPILRQIEEKIDPMDNSEWVIEFYIILSNVLALNFEYEGSVVYLDKSVFVIEKYLDTVSRFHYRRGIREKYYRRIVDILEIVFPKSSPLKLLNVLVYLKTNSQSDWLSIIEWVEQINNNRSIDPEDINELNNKFNNLLNYGGVLVNSFKEKYDDPFEGPSIDTKNHYLLPAYHIPWQDLTIIIQKITFKYSLESPYELNSIIKLNTAISERLNTGSVVLFVFIVSDKYLIYNISDDKNNICEIESDSIIEHGIKLNTYRSPKESDGNEFENPKDQFRTSLESITLRLSYALNDLIDFIVSNKKTSIVIIPDVFDTFLPLFATFFSIDELIEMFYLGTLSIENIPVLFKGSSDACYLKSASVITNKFNSLDLFEEEGKLIEKYFNPNFSYIDVDEGSNLNKWSNQLKESNCIHIISHGRPISFYTDPSFSALDGESLYLASFQEIFLNSQCNLFILNACNSADTVNRNFHKFFKSYEAISHMSVLLQNRKSKVIAAQWPELDTFSYVFTSIFYKKVNNKSNIQTAFAQTVAEIRKSDKQHFLAIISQIENETIREQKKQMIENSIGNQPFDRVLMFGCLNLYSLL